MSFIFDAMKQIRSNIQETVKDLSTEQMHLVPAGMSNSIAWNLGHIVTSQQILCNRLGSLPLLTPDDYLTLFAKGSSPKQWVNAVDVKEIFQYFDTTLSVLVKDYHDKKFSKFNEYKTSSGLILKNIDDAVVYNYGHENLHYGTILEIKKLV